ncbi:MAG: ROK family transcriptional regulator [Sphingomonadales bacterium]|nr:ROK family transcriptional regulator [Sphingomonadales bacterium]MDE2170896.1 ROK family transcriptional regulator [Sphingomonadales bacterium]
MQLSPDITDLSCPEQGKGSVITSQLRLSGTNLERAADHNQRVTLHAIRVNGEITRVDLARITGLTPPSIANITKRLLSDGLIKEAGQRRGGRGQPATRLVINKHACFSIGVNIDRDHITLVIVNFAGEVVASASRDMDFPMPGDARALYADSIERLVAEAGISPALLVGVGVAKPDDFGLVDLPGRPQGFDCWEKTDIAALFALPYSLPVFIENDAAGAAMGEQQLGHGLMASSFFYILVSSGLGGGLVVDGTYFRGADGRSGEIGFMLSREGQGGGDQIQSLVSLSGLKRELAKAGLSVADMRNVDDVPAGLAEVRDGWVNRAAEQLVEPLVAVNCLINPAAVIIGGRLPAAWVDQMAERLNLLLDAKRHQMPAVAPVLRARLAEDAPAVGAAVLPFSYFLLPKATALWSNTAENSAMQGTVA